jgi:hypothetical protein
MAEKTWEFRFQRGSANRWEELNPVLGPGEPGVEVDTGFFKMGDGVTPWNELEHFLTESSVTGIVEVIIAETGGLSSDPRVGDLGDLTTEADETIVEAINELNMEDVSLVLLYENAKAG